MPPLSTIIFLLSIISSLSADVQQVEMGRYEITVPNAFYELNNIRNGDKITASLIWSVNQYLSLSLYEGKKLLQQTASTVKYLDFQYMVKRTGDYYMKVINQYSDFAWYNLTIRVNGVVLVTDDRSVVGYNLRKSYKIFTVQQPCKRVKLISNNSNRAIAIHTRNPDQFNRQSNKQTEYTFSAQSQPETQIFFDISGDWLLITQIKQTFDQIRAMTRIQYRIQYVVKCVVCVQGKEAIQQCQQNYVRNIEQEQEQEKQRQTDQIKEKQQQQKESNVGVEISVAGALVLSAIVAYFVSKRVKLRRAKATLAIAVDNYCQDYSKDINKNVQIKRKQVQQIQQKQTADPNPQTSDTTNIRVQIKDSSQTQTNSKTQMQIQMTQLNSQLAHQNYNNIKCHQLDNFQALQQQVTNGDNIKSTRLSLLDKSQEKQ